MTKEERLQHQILLLQRELEELQNIEIPLPLSEPKFDQLISLAQSHLCDIKHGYEEDDTHYSFYTTALMCIFGEDIFEWVNKHSN